MKPGESPKAVPDTRQTGVAVGVCVLAGIGFIMSIQPVSLLTGTGTVWIGIAIIGIGYGALVLSFNDTSRTDCRPAALA